ncbi:cyclic peptide export ABC transporter [Pseudozobellia sp. WGM2]|uniref:cyclic peptide export ABC transporter n=1 Tax=Pseudozobellia sp. WGM2 TaxID=2787625 RepID=UPI001ADF3646|nr:cyclic peptide export ABC transporter [Pseudozobellia sp. WGM2]
MSLKKQIKKIPLYAILGIMSGLAGFIFIVLVNNVIGLLIKGSMPEENNFMLLFSIVIVLFFISRRLLSQGIIELSQRIFWSIREDITRLIIKAPYLIVSELKDEIYSSLTTDVNNITSASTVLVGFFTSIVLVITCFIYLGYLSLELFFISLLCIGIGALVFFKNAKISNSQFTKVRNLEKDFMRGFNSILEGNKEIKINNKKGDDILNLKILPLIFEGEKRNVNAYVGYLNSHLISQLLFYGIITIILVVISDYFYIELGTTVSFVFALLYLLGPIVNIMISIPVLNRAQISYNKLNYIRNKLNTHEGIKIQKLKILKTDYSFEILKFRDYQYSYPDGLFSVGPINFVLKSNEIVFIYGGNGSGKTTFINMILALQVPQKGILTIDNKKVDVDKIKLTRDLFSPVFSDFYLFEEFYGIVNIDKKKVRRLLKLFEIEHKVSLDNNKLSTTDLSTGQRKRLALIAAIMEGRPILILDEWAADQDPDFKKRFYTEIIHRIVKEENKTIIAITHDDHYYKEADRIYKMDYGKLETIYKTNIK